MRRIPLLAALPLALLLLPCPAAAGEEPVDYGMITRIRDEGFNRSRVMETARHLTDVLGPRLTGSPAMQAANEWTRDQLTAWGLANARLEPYEFGRGWSFSRTSVHLIRPHEVPLVALPKAWSPGTAGPVRGLAMRVAIDKEEDFEQHRGQLAGKVLLLDKPRDLAPPPERPLLLRHSAEDLAEIAQYGIPEPEDDDDEDGGPVSRRLKRYREAQARRDFLAAEGVLASVELSSRDSGIVRVGRGGSQEPGKEPGPPALVMAAEHYNRLVRLVEGGGEVELEIDVAARFHDEETRAFNTVAEIPGRDPEAGAVMVGAHLDSWHGGTGASDNAAGCAVAMEAVRILKALEARARRSIRIALWSGEEQGLLGSIAYVGEHFAARPEPEDPEERELPAFLWGDDGRPPVLKPDYPKLSAYFNLDNGSGKIRGIYAQENAAAAAIFAAWLAPFADLGAGTVSLRKTGATDHVPFDRVGLPGFQFIQDPLDYSTRTHHTNMDVYDHLQREDLMQAAVVLASFLWHAAERPEPLPRRPLPPPRPPASSDPG